MITAEPSGSYIASTEAVAYLAEGELMQKRFFNAAAAVLVAAGATACSSPSASVPPGEIPAGTAKVTINDRALPATTSVKCVPIGWLTTITTGESAAGVTALVSNETNLLAKSVSINGVGGFTGRYMKGIEGRADVSMAGRTYVIRGTADGFNADNPTVRTTGTFAIRVSC
jgi:ipoprotein LpqH